MCEMLDRLGLDERVLARGRLATGLRSAVCTCQSCDADQLCQDWLVRAPEWLEQAPVFCPNAELFAAFGSGSAAAERAQGRADT